MSDSRDDTSPPGGPDEWTDEAIDDLYARGRAGTPPELDARVLTYAAKKQHAPSTKGHRLRMGGGAFATAAVLVLTVVVFLRGGDVNYGGGVASEALPARTAPAAARVPATPPPAAPTASTLEPVAYEAEDLLQSVPSPDGMGRSGEAPLEEIVAQAARAPQSPAPMEAPATVNDRPEHSPAAVEFPELRSDSERRFARETTPYRVARACPQRTGAPAAFADTDAAMPCKREVAHNDCATPYPLPLSASAISLRSDAVQYADDGATLELRCSEGEWRRQRLDPARD